MIVIVVDNKLRDLPSLIPLAQTISQSYHIDVILANIFEIDDLILIYKNKIDLILFSYMRDANKHKIAFARLNNIKIAIYDQEGANGLDGLGVLKEIKINPLLLQCVNGYFFWGKKQLNSASKIIKKNVNIVFKNVGYIRFNINTNLLPKNKVFKKNFILVNSNFALIDPRYNTRKNEIEAVKKNKLYGNQHKKFIMAMDEHKKKFILNIRKLIIENPKINFVLRPHPFENVTIYKKLSNEFPNCFFSSQFNSLTWIKHAKLVLHIDCMTSIEALSLKKKSLSLSYIVKNRKLCYKVPYLSSIHSNNFNDANYKIRQIYFKNKEFQIKNTKIFKDYFGLKEDKPIEKLAYEIVKILLSRDKRKNIKRCEFSENFSPIYSLSKFPIRTRIKILLRKHLSLEKFKIIYKFIVGKKVSEKYASKCFGLDDILIYFNKKNKVKKLYSNSFIFLK